MRRNFSLELLLVWTIATLWQDTVSVCRACEAEAAEVPYSVPEKPWATGLGQHRAVVRVNRSAKAVVAEIPWRR